MNSGIVLKSILKIVRPTLPFKWRYKLFFIKALFYNIYKKEKLETKNIHRAFR